jgi:catalase
MIFRPIKIVAVTALTGFILIGATTLVREPPEPDQLVDALNGVFGKHRGARAAHAKGTCLTGTFTPSADAASLSKAPQFAKTVGIIARFSLGSGNPQAPDGAPDVRGLAVRFDLGAGASSDLVMISVPVFFAATPALAVEFLQALGAGERERLEAFFRSHPESTRQKEWLTSVPASYAETNYFGVHAFTFTNAAGDSRLVKYKAIPEGGQVGLTPDEAKARGPNFYAVELKERLAAAPVVFNLVAIPGHVGDPTNDPTMRWDNEDGRAAAPLGKIMIEKIAPDATCDAFSFLPANLPEGIAGPPDDPIFAARSPAYAVSFIRRSQR